LTAANGTRLTVAYYQGILMDSIQQEKPAPLPLRPAPPRVGTLMLRFVGLLFLAIAAMALVYMR